jgi:hypothetical protein
VERTEAEAEPKFCRCPRVPARDGDSRARSPPSGTPFKRPTGRGPAFSGYGEHNRYVLGDILGLTEAEISALAAAQVLGETD